MDEEPLDFAPLSEWHPRPKARVPSTLEKLPYEVVGSLLDFQVRVELESVERIEVSLPIGVAANHVAPSSPPRRRRTPL